MLNGSLAAEDRSARAIGATVLDKKIYLIPLNPELEAKNRDALSPEEFAEWKSERRWRPLVSKVSYHVMSDWAKRNHVRPNREEIERHFEEEAAQHLQEFAKDMEGQTRVALVVALAISHTVDWATAKALHEKYGGPVAVSSFGGLISIEGRNALLREYAATGNLSFLDPEIEKEFWIGVKDPGVLDVTVNDPERISQMFAKPPWMGWGFKTANLFEKAPE